MRELEAMVNAGAVVRYNVHVGPVVATKRESVHSIRPTSPRTPVLLPFHEGGGLMGSMV